MQTMFWSLDESRPPKLDVVYEIVGSVGPMSIIREASNKYPTIQPAIADVRAVQRVVVVV